MTNENNETCNNSVADVLASMHTDDMLTTQEVVSADTTGCCKATTEICTNDVETCEKPASECCKSDKANNELQQAGIEDAEAMTEITDISQCPEGADPKTCCPHLVDGEETTE